jgi:hypothetical protein
VLHVLLLFIVAVIVIVGRGVRLNWNARALRTTARYPLPLARLAQAGRRGGLLLL